MNVISADKIVGLLKIKSKALIFNTLDSTNKTAKGLAVKGEAEHGDLIIALSQTSGRGRMGRSFYSPEGCGIYFSIVLKPNLPPNDISLITPLAAVAVAAAIEKSGDKDTKIKWVNDIFLKGKKVCGILSEAAFNSSGTAEYVILGIGMNLKAPIGGYPTEIKDIAGSIFENSEHFDANKLIADTVNEFFSLYDDIHSKNIPCEYRKRMMLIGSEINYTANAIEKVGEVLGIDDSFHLIVKGKSGERETLRSGEVTIGSKNI